MTGCGWFRGSVRRETRSFSGRGGGGADGNVEEYLDLEDFLATDSRNKSRDKSRMDAEDSQTWSMLDVEMMR